MRVILALIFLSFSLSLAYGQTNQTESLSFTTYYPSPNGVYKTLKISPGTGPSGAPEPGMIYYSQNDRVIRYYNNTTWVNVTGGNGGGSSGNSWAVITRSCPWGSDGNTAPGGLGFGNQCNPATNNCCSLPACPASWTEVSRSVKIAALDTPKPWDDPSGTGYEWQNGYEGPHRRPAAAGNVVRTCVKQGATVITLSKPWRSDYNDGNNVNKGWGNQCLSPNYLDCSGPAPTCPAGWTNIGTNVEVYSVACPRIWDNRAVIGCLWAANAEISHPLAAGSLVTICEKN